MKTGIAGCGRMGLPMGLALKAGGIDTVGFDIKRANDFGKLPMEFSIEPFAHDLTVLFSVVRDEEQTNALLFEDQNVIKYADALEYLVICSTLSPKFVQELRKRLPRHINLVDAPIAIDWGSHHGLSHAELLNVMRKSSGQTWFGSNFEQIEFARDGYTEDNSIGILAKDVDAAFTAAPDGASRDLVDALIGYIRDMDPLADA